MANNKVHPVTKNLVSKVLNSTYKFVLLGREFQINRGRMGTKEYKKYVQCKTNYTNYIQVKILKCDWSV